ncbi:MAG: tRNA lysidine(34) synthetase TilS [Candidatus Accumulibacter sp.]|jgi:tRNA(Ile)-lysidine synthase|nr:tRNA lysidine(34) synthetase TilS [Accumulibacter sp.]
MNDPVSESIAAFFEKRLEAGNNVCVALSGGRDSVVLLHEIKRLGDSSQTPFSLSALHVHHGLSPKADEWAEFCLSLGGRLGVPVVVSRVEVPRVGGEGIEGAARRARYAALAASGADWVVLGHHRDDQAETLLLNLLRGAGIAGASGMSPERAAFFGSTHRGPRFARPLLDVPRAAIDAYAKRVNLTWIDDESNDDTRFRRNFLRHDILACLETVFPNARRKLARAAKHFAESRILLDELAALDRDRLMSAKGRILLEGFNELSLPRARNLLRFLWMNAGFSMPDKRWIDEALRQLAFASAGIHVSTVDGELRVYRGELFVLPHRPAPPDLPLKYALESALKGGGIPWAGGVIRLARVKAQGVRRESIGADPLVFQTLRSGERMKLHPGRPRKPLAKLFQEAGIPVWERRRLPSLWLQGRLIWVGGIGVDAAYSCECGEEGISLIWSDYIIEQLDSRQDHGDGDDLIEQPL